MMRIQPNRFSSWNRIALLAAVLFFVGGCAELGLGPEGTSPEHAAADLRPGESVTTETLAHQGDKDFFRLTGPTGQKFVIRVYASAVSGVVVRVVSPSGAPVEIERLGGANGPPPRGAWEWITYPTAFEPGTYRIEVTDEAIAFGDTEFPYSVEVFTPDSTPEASDTGVLIHDQVTWGNLERSGDEDAFSFTGVPGDRLFLSFDGMDKATGFFDTLVGDITYPDGRIERSHVFLNDGRSYGPGYFELPVEGPYRVTIRGARVLNDWQPFRLELVSANTPH